MTGAKRRAAIHLPDRRTEYLLENPQYPGAPPCRLQRRGVPSLRVHRPRSPANPALSATPRPQPAPPSESRRGAGASDSLTAASQHRAPGRTGPRALTCRRRRGPGGAPAGAARCGCRRPRARPPRPRAALDVAQAGVPEVGAPPARYHARPSRTVALPRPAGRSRE